DWLARFPLHRGLAHFVETVREQSAGVSAEPPCLRRPGKRGLRRALRAGPDADQPILHGRGHRSGLALRCTNLGADDVFIPGIEAADDFDVRDLLCAARAGVLNALSVGLVVGARTELRERARLPVHLNRA